MKKVIKVLIIVCMILTFTACSASKKVTGDNLDSKLAEMDYVTSDITSEMEDSTIKKVGVASKGSIQLEYYVFKSKESASNAYKNNKETLAANKDYKPKEITNNDYSKVTQKTDDIYTVIVVSKDTMIYSSVNVNYKSDLNKLIKKLGY